MITTKIYAIFKVSFEYVLLTHVFLKCSAMVKTERTILLKKTKKLSVECQQLCPFYLKFQPMIACIAAVNVYL